MTQKTEFDKLIEKLLKDAETGIQGLEVIEKGLKGNAGFLKKFFTEVKALKRLAEAIPKTQDQELVALKEQLQKKDADSRILEMKLATLIEQFKAARSLYVTNMRNMCFSQGYVRGQDETSQQWRNALIGIYKAADIIMKSAKRDSTLYDIWRTIIAKITAVKEKEQLHQLLMPFPEDDLDISTHVDVLTELLEQLLLFGLRHKLVQNVSLSCEDSAQNIKFLIFSVTYKSLLTKPPSLLVATRVEDNNKKTQIQYELGVANILAMVFDRRGLSMNFSQGMLHLDFLLKKS